MCTFTNVILAVALMSLILLRAQLSMTTVVPGDAWPHVMKAKTDQPHQGDHPQHNRHYGHHPPLLGGLIGFPNTSPAAIPTLGIESAEKETMEFSAGLNPEREERKAQRKEIKAELDAREASVLERETKLLLLEEAAKSPEIPQRQQRQQQQEHRQQRSRLMAEKFQLQRDKAIMLRKEITVEAVLSHYNENLTWVDFARGHHRPHHHHPHHHGMLHYPHYPHVLYTVYSKAQPENRPPNTLPLKNVGRESHTYLYHIVHNYEKLAKWTVFSQAAQPTFGYTKGDSGSGHMCSGLSWEHFISYLPDRTWFTAFTYATRFPEIVNSERLDKIFRNDSAAGEACPPDGRNGWGLWWEAGDHPLKRFAKKKAEMKTKKNKNTKKIKEENEIVQGQGQGQGPVDFYNTYISTTELNFSRFILAYAQGARFAVSRERILMRPRSFYERLLHVLAKGVSPIEGYYMEAMWFDVFHPERLQAEHGPVCELPLCSSSSSSSSSSSRHLAAADDDDGETHNGPEGGSNGDIGCTTTHGAMFNDARNRWNRAVAAENKRRAAG